KRESSTLAKDWIPAFAGMSGARCDDRAPRTRLLLARGAVRAVRAVPLRPDDHHPGAVVPGAAGRAHVSDERRLAALVLPAVGRARRGRHLGGVPPLAAARFRGDDAHRGAV